MSYNKYRAIRVNIDQKWFDSKAEGRRYLQLKEMENRSEISNLQTQKRFELQPNFKKNGKTYRKIEYVADFYYIKDGKQVVEDVKSVITKKDKTYIIKKKMFEYKFNDLEIKEIF